MILLSLYIQNAAEGASDGEMKNTPRTSLVTALVTAYKDHAEQLRRADENIRAAATQFLSYEEHYKFAFDHSLHFSIASSLKEALALLLGPRVTDYDSALKAPLPASVTTERIQSGLACVLNEDDPELRAVADAYAQQQATELQTILRARQEELAEQVSTVPSVWCV